MTRSGWSISTALKREHPDDRDYPLGVWTGSMIGKIRDMLTFEGLAYAIYDYPAMVEDMVETACQLVENSLDQILPHFQFDYASGWEDICYKAGPIVIRNGSTASSPRATSASTKSSRRTASISGGSTATAMCAPSCPT